ncbi:hypothetical protein T484DRAFT_1850476 [Baffinella frigidus]|nr:hypothetical protein T484DRAFT_1850476 [Cryptophyta sp. CCMP2293]
MRVSGTGAARTGSALIGRCLLPSDGSLPWTLTVGFSGDPLAERGRSGVGPFGSERCGNCGKTEELRRCNRCRCVSYCSAE